MQQEAKELLDAILSRCDRGACRDDKWPDHKGNYWPLNPLRADKKTGSFSVGPEGWYDFATGEGGSLEGLAGKLGIETSPKKSRRGDLVATYEYRDENQHLLFQVLRYNPKSFSQNRPDGKGGWIWKLEDTRRVLYRLPELLAANPAESVYICEGEKATEAVRAAGLVATNSPHGAGKWRDEYSECLRGRQVVILPDNDENGQEHAQGVARSLHGKAASIKVVNLPGLASKGDAFDWLEDQHHTAGELDALAAAAPEWAPWAAPAAENTPAGETCALPDVVATFRKWLWLPDPGALYAALATIAANRMPGDPVWTLVIGVPGGGKTEMIQATGKLPGIFPTATLTEGALLSGTSKREKAADAKGGLLRQIGPWGILLIKDFGSILALNKDTRGSILQALREIYDGSWTRHIGTDGGRTLHWEGVVGILGGATPAIDAHHAVMAILGERFIFYRLPELDEGQHARGALKHLGNEQEMRAELAGAVSRLFAGLEIPQTRILMTEAEQDWLISLARFTARCRSAVIRDSYQHEIEQIAGVEAPTRLVLVFAKLLAGLKVIGVPYAEACGVVLKTALDSMPQLRRAAIELLADGQKRTTPQIAEMVHHPTITARRALEDLHCYAMIEREPGHTDTWWLSELGQELFSKANAQVESEILSDMCMEQQIEQQSAPPIKNTNTATDSISDSILEDLLVTCPFCGHTQLGHGPCMNCKGSPASAAGLPAMQGAEV